MSRSDARSEVGDYTDIFAGGAGRNVESSGTATGGPARGGFVRAAPNATRGWGRGPVPVDKRKFRYDVYRGITMGPLSFNATKADTLDASEAGDLLHRVHEHFGIASEAENRVAAFDNALWYQHTINGASQLQPGRGSLYVDGVAFDIEPIKRILGGDMRRFFRAFADEIVECNRRILSEYDEYDPEAREKAVRVNAVATKRGLSKFPFLAADSSEAALSLSHEERSAVLVAKPFNLPSEDTVVADSARVMKAVADAKG